MAENPITGTVPLVLKGNEYTLQFTWAAVAQVIREFGQDRDLFDPDVLAGVAAIGLQAHHPGMTPDDVRDGNHIVAIVAPVTKALHYAYFGEQEVPGAGKENPPANAQATATAATVPTTPAFSGRSRGRTGSPTAPASAPANSGA
jgi:hypothetical protein